MKKRKTTEKSISVTVTSKTRICFHRRKMMSIWLKVTAKTSRMTSLRKKSARISRRRRIKNLVAVRKPKVNETRALSPEKMKKTSTSTKILFWLKIRTRVSRKRPSQRKPMSRMKMRKKKTLMKSIRSSLKTNIKLTKRMLMAMNRKTTRTKRRVMLRMFSSKLIRQCSMTIKFRFSRMKMKRKRTRIRRILSAKMKPCRTRRRAKLTNKTSPNKMTRAK